jgi:diacylglycerol kinase (ATP)
MGKNVILVVNPVSGGLDKSELIESAKDFASQKDFHFKLYETSGNDDITKIRELYNQHLPQRIIVAGGDGTIKMVAEAMEHKDVILGIIPAGSANGLAVDLSLPTTIPESLDVAFANNIIELDMIAINGKKSLHLSDIGLNAELIKNYENSDTRGMWGYALQAFTTLKDQEEPFNATIETAEKNIECVARMIVIANSQKYGTGVTINPDGKMDDGKFELVILKNLDMVIFGQIISGNMPINTDDVEIISTDKAIIKTSFPVSFQIDGEYIGTESELQIKILKGQMKVAIP